MTTTNEPKRPSGEGAGYRGTLPPREDRLARPWLMVIAGIFVLIFVLSFLGVPSRLIPEPTPVPLPTIPAPTESPVGSPSPSPDVSPSPSPDGSLSPTPASS